MKKVLLCLSTALAVLLLFTAAALAQPQIPPVPNSSIYVQDYAGILTDETKIQINRVGAELSSKTKAQIVVVTIDTLDGAIIEDYALALLRSWGIGDKTLNNGLLMLIAVNDRKSRIEVGYGLEGALNDAKTGQIQDNYMLPYFQQGDYSKGVMQGYLALATEVAKEYNTTLDEKPAELVPQESEQDISPLTFLLIIGFLAIDILLFGGRITTLLLLFFRRGGGGGRGGGYGGGYGGGSGGGGGSSRSW